MAQDLTIPELKEKIKEGVSRIAPIRSQIRPKTLKKFCDIIEESNPIYFDPQAAQAAGYEKIPVPESYFLTFLAPISQQFFTTGVGRLLKTYIKGIIHSYSEIKFFKQLFCETMYTQTFEMSEITHKKGKMGEYIVATFPLKVVDDKENLVAIDTHVFFLRI